MIKTFNNKNFLLTNKNIEFKLSKLFFKKIFKNLIAFLIICKLYNDKINIFLLLQTVHSNRN